MNAYKELRDRQQKEANAFPFGFAFGNDQFVEMMKKWKLCHGRDGKPTKNDISKIYSIGYGGFVQKKDAPAFHEMMTRHTKEMDDAIAADPDGTGFIRQMFEYEMFNHEYGLTYDIEDTLDALGLTAEQVKSDERLLNGYKLAEAYVCENTF